MPDDGETPNAVSLLQYVAEVNAFGCAEAILGMEVEKLDCGGVWGTTSIHIACWRGHVETLKVLLKKRDSAVTVCQMNPGGAAAAAVSAGLPAGSGGPGKRRYVTSAQF